MLVVAGNPLLKRAVATADDFVRPVGQKAERLKNDRRRFEVEREGVIDAEPDGREPGAVLAHKPSDDDVVQIAVKLRELLDVDRQAISVVVARPFWSGISHRGRGTLEL